VDTENVHFIGLPDRFPSLEPHAKLHWFPVDACTHDVFVPQHLWLQTARLLELCMEFMASGLQDWYWWEFCEDVYDQCNSWHWVSERQAEVAYKAFMQLGRKVRRDFVDWL